MTTQAVKAGVPVIQDSVLGRGNVGGYESGSVVTSALQDSTFGRSNASLDAANNTIVEFPFGVDMNVDRVQGPPAPAPAPPSRTPDCNMACINGTPCAAGCCACDQNGNPLGPSTRKEPPTSPSSDTSWMWYVGGLVCLLFLIFILWLFTRQKSPARG
jgi:hypothetical protein